MLNMADPNPSVTLILTVVTLPRLTPPPRFLFVQPVPVLLLSPSLHITGLNYCATNSIPTLQTHFVFVFLMLQEVCELRHFW